MNKLTGKQIIDIIKKSRQTDYLYEECWKNLEDMGLSEDYKEQLGTIVLVDRNPLEWGYDIKAVWHFVDHDVYIKAGVSEGSYSSGHKLDTWTLKQVLPTKKEIIIYEEAYS
jgi:hypothetical protein